MDLTRLTGCTVSTYPPGGGGGTDQEAYLIFSNSTASYNAARHLDDDAENDPAISIGVKTDDTLSTGGITITGAGNDVKINHRSGGIPAGDPIQLVVSFSLVGTSLRLSIKPILTDQYDQCVGVGAAADFDVDLTVLSVVTSAELSGNSVELHTTKALVLGTNGAGDDITLDGTDCVGT